MHGPLTVYHFSRIKGTCMLSCYMLQLQLRSSEINYPHNCYLTCENCESMYESVMLILNIVQPNLIRPQGVISGVGGYTCMYRYRDGATT